MSNSSNVKREFSYTWNIENFSSCFQDNKEYIESPHCLFENIGKMKWSMQLYPRGDAKEKDYISVYFGKATEREVETTISSFRISIVGPDGGTLATHKTSENILFSSKHWGWSAFIKLDELFRKLKNWTKDTLTVICTIVSQEPVKKIASGCVARTKIGLDRCSFKWNVKSPDSPDWSASKKFPFPGENSLGIKMDSPLEEITISIRLEKKSSSFFMSCTIHLLDVEGVKRDSRKYRKLISAGSSMEPWALPPFVTRKLLLQDSELLLKNGFFSLMFDFSVSNEIESNVIESYDYEPKSVEEDSLSFNFIYDLQDDLRRLFENREHGDVSFIISGEKVKAHKSILAARSPVLSTMLQHVEEGIEIVDVPNLNSRTWDGFLEFLYTGTLKTIDYEIASKLLVIADKYQAPSLKEKCTTFLLSILSESNVGDMLLLANKFDNEVLKTNALEYIRMHASTILPGLDWTKWVENNN